MKILLVLGLSLGSWFVASVVAGNPGAPEVTSPPSDPVHDEIAHLRRDFDRQRAEAVRPIATQYLARLEALRRSVREQDRAVEAELTAAVKAARETYWQEDQPELRHALLTRSWVWRSDVDAVGVAVTFHGDGVVEHVGLHGNWRITGPNEVTIASNGDGDYVLRFDAPLRNFEGDQHEIRGNASPSSIETLCANIWSLRGDKLEFRRNGRLVQHGDGWEGKDWRLSSDGKQVTITFTNGNGGTFQFENGIMTHFDGTPFQSAPRR